MKRFGMAFILVASVVFIATMVCAAECPQEIAADFPTCGESKVVQMAKINDATMLVLDVNKSVDSTYSSYKDLAMKHGWKITMEMSQDNSKILMGEKNDKQIVMNFQNEDGKTMLQITLSKKN